MTLTLPCDPPLFIVPPARGFVAATLFATLLPGCSFGLTVLNPDTGIIDSADADADADSDTDSDADSDTDSDADADADGLVITKVTPAYGTTAGGGQVVIKGGPFGDPASVSVRFGSDLATIDSVTASEVHVTTPSASVEGAVDVQVTTGSDAQTLTSGFYYVEDATGQTGAIGLIYWIHVVGTGFGSPPPADVGSAFFSFTSPTNVEYYRLWSPTMDTCTSGYTSSASYYIYDFGVDTTSWAGSNGSTINFAWDAAYGDYTVASINNSQFAQGGSYDQANMAPADFPAFSMPDIAETPSSFSVTTPNIAASSLPAVSKSAFSLGWGGVPGDYMLVELDLYNSAGDAIVESVTCALNDDGSFNVPSSVWRSWATNRALVVLMARVTLSSAKVPYNNGNSEVAGAYFVEGVARTQ